MAIIYFPAPRTFWPPIISRSIASQYEFIKSPFLILRKVFRAQEPKTKFHITMLELFHQGHCTALDDIKYWYEPTKTFFFVSTQYFVDLGRARSIYICTAYNPHIFWIDVRPRDHHRSFLPLLCLSSFCTFYLPRNMLLFEFVYLQKINLIKAVMEFTFGILDFTIFYIHVYCRIIAHLWPFHVQWYQYLAGTHFVHRCHICTKT